MITTRNNYQVLISTDLSPGHILTYLVFPRNTYGRFYYYAILQMKNQDTREVKSDFFQDTTLRCSSLGAQTLTIYFRASTTRLSGFCTMAYNTYSIKTHLLPRAGGSHL
jgi:hypothetical protein